MSSNFIRNRAMHNVIVETDIWRVVIVDPSPARRAAIKAALRHGSRRPYDLAEAETGGQGLGCCQAGPRPACLIVASRLPDMTALDFLGALPRAGDLPASAVVVLTDAGEPTREMLRAGAQGFVGQEWMTPDSLTQIVECAIDRHAMALELAQQEPARADRQAALLALRASEELNRSLMDGSADCVKVLDTAGQMLHINAPGLCQMEIDDFNPLCGQAWSSLWPDPAPVLQAVEEARSGRIASFEAYCPTAKGAPKWWEVTVSPVRADGAGEVVRLLAVSRDVTGRRLAIEAMRESEHRLRLALEGAEIGMWDWDVAAGAVRWSPQCYVIHGLAEDEFDGTADGFGRLIYPADAESVWTAVRAAAAGHHTYDSEFRIVRPGGEIRWVTNKGRALYDDAGQPTRMIGIITDITERRLADQAVRDSEERLRMAQAVARIGTFACDPVAGLLWTPEMEALHGLAPGTFSGRYDDWLSLVHPEDRDGCDSRVTRAKETGIFEGEWRIIRPDGTVRWVAGRASVRRLMAEDPGVLVGVNIDVTAEKELETEREQFLAAEQAARIEIERVAQIKDEFLATLSHELRTPISAIVGWAQILERTDISSASEKLIRQGLEVIGRNANAQSQLISELLDMNRIVTGKLKLTAGPVYPNLLSAAAADTFRPTAEAKQVELELRLQENLPQLMGDPGRLQQVLWNLLTNAIKFTPPGGKVTLTTTGDEKTVRFAIADTGQGIDPSFLPRLFDRFSQADASAARKHGGLGLGLSIARQLVEMHGGSISAASEGLGRGATFTVTLPASLPAAPSPPHWPPAADGSGRDLAPQPAEISLQGIRVLMVDDQLDTLEATSRILAEFGAVVTTASSAPAAIDHLRRERQHILLSDIGMPEVDGYYLIRVVRETLGLGTRDLPAIALTAFSRPEDKDRALAAGYQAHFAKPIRPEALVPVIAALARPGAAASLVSIGEA